MQHRPPISSLQPPNRFPGWPCPPWTPQFQAHPCDPSYPWSTFPDNPSSNPRLPSDTSSSQTSLARELRETLGEFKKSLISDLKVVCFGVSVRCPGSLLLLTSVRKKMTLYPWPQEASFLTRG